MDDNAVNRPVHPERLRELLLGYLLAAREPPWPGSDGQTLDEVLHSYLQSAARRRVPGWQELVHRHPELRTELAAFFAGGSARCAGQ